MENPVDVSMEQNQKKIVQSKTWCRTQCRFKHFATEVASDQTQKTIPSQRREKFTPTPW